VSAFNALTVGPDGRLFGTVLGEGGPEMFVFDPVSRTFVNRVTLPEGRPLDLGLQVGPDGAVYGFTTRFFYRVDITSLSVDVVFESVDMSAAGPIMGQAVYFASGERLLSAQVF
jgi:hypothetical protein